MVILVTFFFFACFPNTPFESGSGIPIPIIDSYISLQKRTGFLIKAGSAVIIADGVAVSNRHLMENQSEMRCYMAGGIEFPIKNVILSDRFDLAVFDIPCGLGKPIHIGKRVHKGDNILSIGTTFGSTIFKGYVVLTDLRLHHLDMRLPNADNRDSKGRSISHGFVYEGETKIGFSGGPIMNSKWELVGINQGKVYEVYSATPEIKMGSDKTYGVGYHIEDVLDEIRRIAPKKLNRCR